MSIDAQWPEVVLWAAVFLAWLGHNLLFRFARRPCGLRRYRWGWFAWLAVHVRAGLVFIGYPVTAWWDCGFFAIANFVALNIWLGKDEIYIHDDVAEVRDKIANACSRLFLTPERKTPDHYVFITADGAWNMYLIEGHRIHRLLLPPLRAGGKVALLVQWLLKQYPGPFPRIKIVLTKEA